MTEQTPEERWPGEAEAAAEMGMDLETYRERDARFSDFQPLYYGNVNDPESFLKDPVPLPLKDDADDN